MLKIKHAPLNWLGIGIILSVMSATISPAAAQSIIIINNDTTRFKQSPPVSSFIYGSPIPTPVPVDPVTGLIHNRSTLRQNVRHGYHQTQPILINPRIQDSTLVNPVIINNSRHHTPFRGRSRVIINNSRYHRGW